MLGLLLGALAALNGPVYRHARAMLSFQSSRERTAAPEQVMPFAKLHVLLLRVGVPRPHSTRSPSALDPSCRSLTIAAPQAVTLASWYCGERPQVPLVILFDGYAAEKSGRTAEARTFLGLGASVLLVDFRGPGGSSESYTTLGAQEAQDVRAVVDYARSALAHPSLIL